MRSNRSASLRSALDNALAPASDQVGLRGAGTHANDRVQRSFWTQADASERTARVVSLGEWRRAT